MLRRAVADLERFESLEIVEIRWWDAQTYYGKYTPSEVQNLRPSTGNIVGYLLKETDDYYVLSPMVFTEHTNLPDDCDDVKFIPKNGVISIKRLDVKVIE